jgi:hypothetical protein
MSSLNELFDQYLTVTDPDAMLPESELDFHKLDDRFEASPRPFVEADEREGLWVDFHGNPRIGRYQ